MFYKMMFYKKRCSYIFCNIYRKTVVLESFINKVARLKACNFIKKRLQHKCFPVWILPNLNNLFEKHLRTTASGNSIFDISCSFCSFWLWVKELHNYLTMLKNKKSFRLFVISYNWNRAFHHIVKNWQLWGSFKG